MSTLWNTIAADVTEMAKMREKSVSGVGLLDTLLLPGTMAVLLFRLSNVCYHRRLRPISRLLYLMNVMLFGADIAPPARIGPGFVIGHPVGVVIAGPTVAGKNLKLFGQCGLGGSARRNISRDGFPVLGDNVAVFLGGRVFGPVTIGDNAWIAANAVVIHDVPAGGTAVGVPARVRNFGRPANATNGTAEADEVLLATIGQME